MRIERADIHKSYVVHKTYNEFCHDVGVTPLTEEEGVRVWFKRLNDDDSFFYMLMHGRKVVGMVWGRKLPDLSKKTFQIEGLFLRRAYRGKFRFTKHVAAVKGQLKENFEKVHLVVPGNRVTIKRRYPVLGTILEVK